MGVSMQNLYADIIVDITHEKLDRTFQYIVPDNMQADIKAGSYVRIPFGGGNREIDGYVIGLSDEAKIDAGRMKEIASLAADILSVESRMIALADWMRVRYGCTMIQALRTVMPFREEAKKKDLRSISLLLSIEEARSEAARLEAKHQSARARVVRGLIETPHIGYSDALRRFKTTKQTLTTLHEAGVLAVASRQIYRDPVGELLRREGMDPPSPGLTAVDKVPDVQQRQVLDGIEKEWAGANRPSLILGVTGSGKTLVYLKLMERVVASGRQAVLLIPEIALTVQNVVRFYAHFGDTLSIIHSRMTKEARFDQMERARRGEIRVIIGPRSALFAPFPNPGLVIIDEEHESSYNSEVTPRYRSVETAGKLCALSGAHLVLGSATPSIESYYHATHGRYALFTLSSRHGDVPLPDVAVVDMREELRAGNRRVFSRALMEAIGDRLEKKEQIMLFLNRRGYSGFISCRSCGHVVKCPHCDVSLTLHAGGVLRCHYCGYTRPNLTRCPECGSPYIGGFKAGTQQIEGAIHHLYPQAGVLRMDADTTRGKFGHAKILEAFAKREADILVGTQMIVKGHDFPHVTLMGILAADLTLFADDFRAAEHTYQQLVQAIGRAGRRGCGGLAVIQTYHPDHYAIAAAKSQDYRTFYEEEIAYRALVGYPPVRVMMAVHVEGEDEAHAQAAIDYLHRFIGLLNKEGRAEVIGPADASVAKVKDMYRKVLYLRANSDRILFGMRRQMERYIKINEGFGRVSVHFENL